MHNLWPGSSGPANAVVFQRVLALIFVIAWISLATQVRLLIGPRGLMPLGAFLDGAGPLPILGYPSLLRWQALSGNGALLAGTIVGVVVALVALAGWRPRVCFGLSTFLYLGYATACRTFLSFQWDNLLLECGLLAVFLPGDRPAPLAHLLFRLLAFKLYFESGIAKAQSSLHDWQDGSAMTFYYETAPLPTALAWYAHHLPAWWHHFESRATLVLELGLPVGMFGPRRVRLAAVAAFTGFQIINAATANYGFFCYLAVALHLFLLDDGDVAGLARWLPLRPAPAAQRRIHPIAWLGGGVWVWFSLVGAAVHFTDARSLSIIEPQFEAAEPLRLVNTYHLFASITRTRIEPQFEVQTAGGWHALDLWHKPGDPRRRPDFVAPHQPRVDFQLWFYGLSFQRTPHYVLMLLERLCRDPGAVAPLFRERPPAGPQAARIAYYQYQFTTRAERRATGAWWNRTLVDTTAAVPCDR